MNESLIYIIPLLIAGLIHHFIIIRFNLFKVLVKPIDHGSEILGKNKTYRGLIVMTIISGITLPLIPQQYLTPSSLPSALIGSILGLAYALGELPNSLLKRRFHIKPGESRFPFSIFDQIDSVAASAFALYLLTDLSCNDLLILVILGSCIHFLVDQVLLHFSYKKTVNSSSH